VKTFFSNILCGLKKVYKTKETLWDVAPVGSLACKVTAKIRLHLVFDKLEIQKE